MWLPGDLAQAGHSHPRVLCTQACLLGLTCLLQRLEAPGHLPDAGVEAAAPVVTLLLGDPRVAAVHPLLGWDLTLVLRCPNETQSVARTLLAQG